MSNLNGTWILLYIIQNITDKTKQTKKVPEGGSENHKLELILKLHIKRNSG